MSAKKIHGPSAAIVIFILGVLLIPLISYIRYMMQDYNYPPFTQAVRLSAIVIFSILFCGYYLYIKRGRYAARLNTLLPLGVFSLGIFLSSIPPIFSIDLYEYVIRGRMVSIYHINPYLYVPNDIKGDLFFNIQNAKIFWENSTMIYGPVWTYLVSFFACIAKNSVFFSLFLVKLFLFSLHVLAAFFMYKIAKSLQIEKPDIIAFAYLLNPLVLVMTGVEGHMDMVMTALLLLAVLLLFMERFYLSFLTLAVSALTKYFPILFFPFFVIYMYNAISVKKIFFKKLFISCVIMLLAVVLMYRPLWIGLDTFSELKSVLRFDSCSFPYIYYKIISFAFPALTEQALRYATYAVFALIYILSFSAFAVSRNKKQTLLESVAVIFSAYILIAAFQLNAWYLVCIIPFALFLRVPLKYELIALISFAALISFWKRMSFLLIFAFFIYLILVLISKMSLWKKQNECRQYKHI